MGCGASVTRPPEDQDPPVLLELDKKPGERSGLYLGTGPLGYLRVQDLTPDSPFTGLVEEGDELMEVNGVEVKDPAKAAELILDAEELEILGRFNKPPPPKKRKVLFISEVRGFDVPPVNESRESDVLVKFTLLNGAAGADPTALTDDGGVGLSASTTGVVNEANPAWYGRPLICLPKGFTEGQLRVGLWDENVKRPEDALAKGFVTINPAELSDPSTPKALDKVELAGNNGLPNCSVSFKVCVMDQAEALKLKAEAAKVVKAAAAAKEAEKVKAAKEAARAKAAKAKAAKEAAEKAAAEKAAAKAEREKAAAEMAAAKAAREKAAAEKAAAEAEAARIAAEELAAAVAAAAAAAEEEKERLRAEADAKAEAERLRLEAEAAAKAAAEEEARLAAEAQALAEAEFTLIIRDVSAHGVPDADAKPGKKKYKGPQVDPYARFTMLGVQGVETGRTQPQFNTCDPVFPFGVQISLPMGSEAAMAHHAGKPVQVRAEVWDKDLTDEDDRLGKAVFTLEGSSGKVSKAALTGCSGFGDSAMSFSWEITSQITPWAICELSEVSATNVPTGLDLKSGPGGRGSDPYLKFVLLEVGDYDSSTRLPTIWNESNPKWKETVALELPRASSRPPLINVRLWDDDVGDGDDPIGSTDVRLTGGSEGVVEFHLPIRKGLVKKPKKMRATFKYKIIVDPEDE